jgi:hypothetical protein
VNVLAFGKSTEENCRILLGVHKQCTVWARKHLALFAREMYIFELFTTTQTKHNHLCPLTLPTTTVLHSPSA